MTPQCEFVHPSKRSHSERYLARCTEADDLLGTEIEFIATLSIVAILEFGDGKRLERKLEKARFSDEYTCRHLFPRSDGAS
jgi:hypothetical protein